MRYACLIYYNPKTLFGGSPEANAVLAECSTYELSHHIPDLVRCALLRRHAVAEEPEPQSTSRPSGITRTGRAPLGTSGVPLA